MDADALRILRQQQDRESARRAAGATRDPRTSTGGGGFIGNTNAPKRPSVDAYTPPDISATALGGALDTGAPAKVYGIDTFSDDDIARGHRAGGTDGN